MHCVVDHADGSQAASTVLMLSLARKLTLRVSRGSNVLSSYTQTQLYTDAALVLDASTRVAAAAGSGLIDLHLHGVVDHPDETGWVAGCNTCAHVHHVDL